MHAGTVHILFNIELFKINYRLIAKVTLAFQMLRVRKVLVPKDIVAFVRRDTMEINVNWVSKNIVDLMQN